MLCCLNFAAEMKPVLHTVFILLFLALFIAPAYSQCAVCTKTALQLGEKPAAGLNSAILYLMASPFIIVGFIGYRWWKGNKKYEEEQDAIGNRQ